MPGWDACQGAPPPRLVEVDALLTTEERRALELTSEISTLLRKICGPGPIGEQDFNELVPFIHVIQRTIGSQATARAFPETYRLLGRQIPPREPLPSVGP